MPKGFKVGGRKKGTPNKDKKALLDLINERFPGYHPVVSMADIANDESQTMELRASMHKEVSQYVEPKRKSVELSGGLDARIIYKPLVKRLDGSMDDEDT